MSGEDEFFIPSNVLRKVNVGHVIEVDEDGKYYIELPGAVVYIDPFAGPNDGVYIVSSVSSSLGDDNRTGAAASRAPMTSDDIFRYLDNKIKEIEDSLPIRTDPRYRKMEEMWLSQKQRLTQLGKFRTRIQYAIERGPEVPPEIREKIRVKRLLKHQRRMRQINDWSSPLVQEEHRKKREELETIVSELESQPRNRGTTIAQCLAVVPGRKHRKSADAKKEHCVWCKRVWESGMEKSGVVRVPKEQEPTRRVVVPAAVPTMGVRAQQMQDEDDDIGLIREMGRHVKITGSRI